MKKTTGLLILLLLIGVAGYFYTTNSTATDINSGSVAADAVNKNKEITIAMVTFPGYGPLYLAEEKNLWGEGYDVNLVRIESLGDMRTAMLAGKIDMYAGTYDMFLATEGVMPPGKAVLAMDESTGGDGVVVDSSITSLNDLVGEDVAAEAGLPPHFLLMYALYEEGLSLDDLSFKDMPSADAGASFIAKQTDIAGTYEPYLSNAVASREGSKILLSSADTPGLVVDFLWASDDAIAEKEGVESIVSGWYAALDYLETNEDEAYTIMGEAFGVDGDEMRGFDEGIDWLDREENKNLFDKENDNSAYANYELVQNILTKNGVELYPTKATNKIIGNFIDM